LISEKGFFFLSISSFSTESVKKKPNPSGCECILGLVFLAPCYYRKKEKKTEDGVGFSLEWFLLYPVKGWVGGLSAVRTRGRAKKRRCFFFSSLFFCSVGAFVADFLNFRLISCAPRPPYRKP
jgi:hypothetical protein